MVVEVPITRQQRLDRNPIPMVEIQRNRPFERFCKPTTTHSVSHGRNWKNDVVRVGELRDFRSVVVVVVEFMVLAALRNVENLVEVLLLC